MPHPCELYPGICFTTEEKAPKTLSQGSRSVPVGTMKHNIHNRTYITIRIYNKIEEKHKKHTSWTSHSDTSRTHCLPVIPVEHNVLLCKIEGPFDTVLYSMLHSLEIITFRPRFIHSLLFSGKELLISLRDDISGANAVPVVICFLELWIRLL